MIVYEISILSLEAVNGQKFPTVTSLASLETIILQISSNSKTDRNEVSRFAKDCFIAKSSNNEAFRIVGAPWRRRLMYTNMFLET